MIDEQQLKSDFEQAVKTIQSTPRSAFNPDNALKLKMYGLYKQATSGQATGKRPGLLDPVGRAKFDAWFALKETPQTEAMKAYVEIYREVQKKIQDQAT